jgi:hypothetical protein
VRPADHSEVVTLCLDICQPANTALRNKGGSTQRTQIDSGHGGAIRKKTPWHGTAANIFVQTWFPQHSGRILISLMRRVVAMLSETGVYICWKKSAARRLQAQQG